MDYQLDLGYVLKNCLCEEFHWLWRLKWGRYVKWWCYIRTCMNLHVHHECTCRSLTVCHKQLSICTCVCTYTYSGMSGRTFCILSIMSVYISCAYMHYMHIAHIQSTNQSSTAFLAYVLMSGLQFSQAGAVVRRLVSATMYESHFCGHKSNLTQL